MKWESTTIGEQCIVTSSKRVHLSERSDEGVPFYCSKEIIQKYKGEEITECDYIREEIYTEIAQKFGVPQENDLLVTTRGTIGIPYLYRNTDRFYFADGNLTWMKNFKKTMLPQYLYYWFLTHEGRKKVEAIAKGTAQKAVPIAGIKGLKISLPSIAKQRQIIGVLSAYDNFIENNQKQIKLLEEAAQRLYKEWFVDLRFPGHENTKITDGIPEGWEYKPIFDVFDFVRGRSYTSNELSDSTGVLMVNLKNIRAFGGYNRNAEKRFVGQFKDNQILSAGDVIMGVTDMTQERRLVGYVALVPNMGETMIFSMDLIKLIPKRTDNLFLYSAMMFGGVSKRISPLANGVNVLHLKPEAIMGVEMLIPNDKIVCQYHSQIDPVFSQIETLQKQCDAATEARDRLLSKLMNGEIRGG